MCNIFSRFIQNRHYYVRTCMTESLLMAVRSKITEERLNSCECTVKYQVKSTSLQRRRKHSVQLAQVLNKLLLQS